MHAGAEELGSKELEIESKKFLVEVKVNDQGKFVKILEVRSVIGNIMQINMSETLVRLLVVTHTHSLSPLTSPYPPPSSPLTDADTGKRSDHFLS